MSMKAVDKKHLNEMLSFIRCGGNRYRARDRDGEIK